MVAAEGVIKFDLRFQNSPLENSVALTELLRWRGVFYRLGAIGQDPDRYAGDAFGNISCRLGNSSFDFEAAIFAPGDEQPFSTAKAACVWFNYRENRSIPIPARERGIIQQFEGIDS